MVPQLSTYPSHLSVGTVTVPTDGTRALDLGLSAAILLWTDEMLMGEVDNWHRYAVEINTLRNDLRDVSRVDLDQPELVIPIRLGSWAALVAATIACARKGPYFAASGHALQELAQAVERIVVHPTSALQRTATPMETAATTVIRCADDAAVDPLPMSSPPLPPVDDGPDATASH